MVIDATLPSPELVLIVPTRQRPDNARRLLTAFYATIADSDRSHIWFVVDDDDPCMNDYLTLHTMLPHLIISSPPGPPGMVHSLNFATTFLDSTTHVVGFCGDDHLPRTLNWDGEIVRTMKHNGVSYGNDLLQGANLPTAVFLDNRIVEALGYMAPPSLYHLYVDNTWKTWGERLGTLTYLPDVIIEHLHPVAGKATSDESYEQNNSSETYTHDEVAYREYCRTDLERDLGYIRKTVN